MNWRERLGKQAWVDEVRTTIGRRKGDRRQKRCSGEGNMNIVQRKADKCGDFLKSEGARLERRAFLAFLRRTEQRVWFIETRRLLEDLMV